MAYTSKEIIRRLVRHEDPIRIGYDFHSASDVQWVGSRRYVDLPDNPYDAWGHHEELARIKIGRASCRERV